MNKLEEEISVKKFLNIAFGFIGLISATLGIYAFFFIEKETSLEYEILSNTNVLDINANITKLDILYGGNSLKVNNQSLRIISFRVRNNGNESILKNYYDDNDPLGAIISNGKIIEKPELLSASSNYLKKNLNLRYDNSNKIYFGNVIIEPNEFFTIKILILYNTSNNPVLFPIGKIAGVKNIETKKILQDQKKESFWVKTFGGDLLSQLVRGIAYTIIVIIIIVIIGVSFDNLSTKYTLATKRKIIKRFKANSNYVYNPAFEKILHKFVDEDYRSLKILYNNLQNDNDLESDFKKWYSAKNVLMDTGYTDYQSDRLLKHRFYPISGEAYIQTLIELEIIYDESTLILNAGNKDFLIDFITFLDLNYTSKKLKKI